MPETGNQLPGCVLAFCHRVGVWVCDTKSLCRAVSCVCEQVNWNMKHMLTWINQCNYTQCNYS